MTGVQTCALPISVSLCQENELPMIVFNMNVPDNLLKIVKGATIGTIIHNSLESREKV